MTNKKKSILLTPPRKPTAVEAYKQGNSAFVKYLLNPEISLTIEDRKFFTKVFEHLYWRAYESKRKPPPNESPPYRSPGANDLPLLETFLDLLSIVGAESDLTPKEAREVVSFRTRLSWNQIRGRVNRMKGTDKEFARRLFGLQGRREQ